MTTREKVERLLDQLSEEELATEYHRLQQAVGGAHPADDLSDLERFGARASRGVLRHMTEDEEKAGLSWEELRRSEVWWHEPPDEKPRQYSSSRAMT